MTRLRTKGDDRTITFGYMIAVGMAQETQHDTVVAIGASAGGLVALQELIAELPEKLSVPIVIGVHSDPNSRLADVLKRCTRLPIKELEDGETLRKGWVYTIPGARHAFFRDGRMRVSDIVTQSGFRPSIDALFITLAAEYGAGAIAVVLSGTLKDSMRGAQLIYDMGGQTIVQDPEDAAYKDMPASVINADHPRKILSAAELGKWLGNRIGAPGNA